MYSISPSRKKSQSPHLYPISKFPPISGFFPSSTWGISTWFTTGTSMTFSMVSFTGTSTAFETLLSTGTWWCTGTGTSKSWRAPRWSHLFPDFLWEKSSTKWESMGIFHVKNHWRFISSTFLGGIHFEISWFISRSLGFPSMGIASLDDFMDPSTIPLEMNFSIRGGSPGR